MSETQADQVYLRPSLDLWLLMGVFLILVAGGFYDGIEAMAQKWSSSEEYGYGYFIPVITLFLIWQRKNELAQVLFRPSWVGVAIVLFGLSTAVLGQLATTYTLVQYSLIIVVMGLAWTIMGWTGFRIVAIPLAVLFFMVPLPPFLYNNLSLKLQLISSEIGVAIIRLFDISVYLEGNVIDLGIYKLQVVEACSGLRYLFPLTSLSFLIAYFYKAPFWKKAVIFVSSVPITIFMNCFRIGMIGVLVEYWGIEQAEGFLHNFEGWAIFMACMALLGLEMVMLNRIGRHKTRLADTFTIDLPAPIGKVLWKAQTVRLPHLVVVAAVVATLVGIQALGQRMPVDLSRESFSEFPLRIGDWEGRTDRLESIYLDALKLDDYIVVNYANGKGNQVNLYMAYYADQVAGAAIHSPRSCIPGGGWLIDDLSQPRIKGATINGQPLVVNRVVIKKGEFTQILYYWFQQRGRIQTNEYLVKLYLFWDALLRNRTDGALIRLSTVVTPGQDLQDADVLLQWFAKAISDRIPRYVPS